MKKLFLLVLLAALSVNGQVIEIKHAAYEIHLDTVLREPVYTHYVLTPEMTSKHADRSHFTFDPKVNRKYQGTGFGSFDNIYGYDRGHLAPDIDFRANETTEKEAMYYDNTAVQNSKLNRGTWKTLEKYIHDLGNNANVEVWTGCLYKDSKIAFNGLTVPSHYWKLIKYNGVYHGWKMLNVPPLSKDFNDYQVDPAELLKLIK